jgi:hypothetical protein
MSASAPASPLRQGFFRRNAPKLAASAVLTIVVLFLVRNWGIKIIPEGADFAQVRWWTVPVYALTLLVMTWFRSIRWRYLLRSIAEVPPKRLFAISCVGFAAILLFPFRIGEFVRPYMIRTPAQARAAGVRPITLTAATSSIVAERVIDGTFVTTVLALALLLVPTVHPLPDHVVGIPVPVARVRAGGYFLFGLFVALLAAISVFYFARGWAHRTTIAVVGRVSMPLALKLASVLEKFADGLHVLGRFSDAVGFLTETSFYWGANVTGMWVLAWGCGVVHADGTAPTFGEACAMMGTLGAAVLVPAPPGLLGVFQAGIYAGMTMFYPTKIVTTAGAAYVFLLYAVQFVFTVVTAGWGIVAEWGAFRALEASAGTVPAAADAE